MPEVRVENITLRHRGGGPRGGDQVVLKGVSLEVAAGEWMVVVGPSGAGKTSLLRVVAGLEQPEAGTVRIGGRDVGGVPSARRGVSMVFQDPPLFPHLSVRENLRLGVRLSGRGGRDGEGRIDAWVERLGLGGLLDRRPEGLSGGERQRVALVSALGVGGDVLHLLDEPLAQLDGPMRWEVRAALREARAQAGGTWLQVTHDQGEAMAMADRLVVLRDGVVQQVGRPMDLYRCPANVFVARFLGSPGMSVVSGCVERRPAGAVFCVEGGGEIACGTLPVPGEGRWQLGVRPVGWRLVSGAEREVVARGVVDAVEPMGHEAWVRVRVGASVWVVRAGWGEVGSDAGWLGREVGLGWAGGGVGWFEAGSGVWRGVAAG